MKFLRTYILAAVIGLTSASASFAGDKTLYDRLGGHDGVTAIISGTLDYTLKDERIAHTFAESNVERVERLLVEQICSLTDGGCEYTGMDMARAHYGLELTSMHFNALVENLQKAMDDEGVKFTTQNQLLAILAPMHGDVVHPEKALAKEK